MTKQQISSSSKLVDARTLAIYALDQFINYIRTTVDTELKANEATLLAGHILQSLPELFTEDPAALNQFRELAAEIKHKKRNAQRPTN